MVEAVLGVGAWTWPATVWALLAVVLVSAGFGKLSDLRGFMFAISTWQLVPIRRIRLMASVIVGYELLLGATLGAAVLAGGSLGPLRADTIAAVVATTMLAFALGQIWLWRVRGRKARCGCFGAESVVGWRSIGRAGLLVAVCIPGLVLG